MSVLSVVFATQLPTAVGLLFNVLQAVLSSRSEERHKRNVSSSVARLEKIRYLLPRVFKCDERKSVRLRNTFYLIRVPKELNKTCFLIW
jgi:hypothetical protein